MSGLHIGFSGIDEAGKSTQVALLAKWLREEGENAIRYEETRNFVQETTDLMGRRHGLSSGREYIGEGLYMVSMVFGAILIAIFFSALAAQRPARGASKIPPVDALRYE